MGQEKTLPTPATAGRFGRDEGHQAANQARIGKFGADFAAALLHTA
jgi:hypothetical protein